MATYLVIGGAGFIGSHIVDELVRRGERDFFARKVSRGEQHLVTEFHADVEVGRVDQDLAVALPGQPGHHRIRA